MRLGYRPVRGVLRRTLSQLPFNDALSVEINEKVLEVPRLDHRLDGISIAHVSDLHLDGTVDKEFFRCAVELVNAMRADFVVLTGDIVDGEAQIDWLSEILGGLRAPFGVYFILGNHDLKVPSLARLRHVLGEAGLIDVGGRWLRLNLRDVSVVLAGDELPWIPPAVDLRDCPPPSSQQGPLRILLAHTPDRLNWARRNEFDVMLAGHTHGGQLRFPVIGPLVSPCRQGVRYDANVFHLPPTILHVSRGLSETFPLRLRCPGELTRLVLRAASLRAGQEGLLAGDGARTVAGEAIDFASTADQRGL